MWPTSWPKEPGSDTGAGGNALAAFFAAVARDVIRDEGVTVANDCRARRTPEHVVQVPATTLGPPASPSLLASVSV